MNASLLFFCSLTMTTYNFRLTITQKSHCVHVKVGKKPIFPSRHSLRSASGLASSSSLSLLPLSRPALLRSLFNFSLDSAASAFDDQLLFAPLALARVWSHPRLAAEHHLDCQEDAGEWRKRCAEGANLYLKQVILSSIFFRDVSRICGCFRSAAAR